MQRTNDDRDTRRRDGGSAHGAERIWRSSSCRKHVQRRLANLQARLDSHRRPLQSLMLDDGVRILDESVDTLGRSSPRVGWGADAQNCRRSTLPDAGLAYGS